MTAKPSPTEIALKEAAGFRLIYINGQPNWVKDCTFTPDGGKPIPLQPARIVGTDGADTRPLLDPNKPPRT